MAIALMRSGKRVGVTSLSHKAIHNFLRAVHGQQSSASRSRGRSRDGRRRAVRSRAAASSPRRGGRRGGPIVPARRRHRLGADAQGGRPPHGCSGLSTCSSSTKAGQLALADVLAGEDVRPRVGHNSATRTSSRRSRRARTPRAPSDPCSSICSATTSPSMKPRAVPRETWRLGPSSARSRPTRTTAGTSGTHR